MRAPQRWPCACRTCGAGCGAARSRAGRHDARRRDLPFGDTMIERLEGAAEQLGRHHRRQQDWRRLIEHGNGRGRARHRDRANHSGRHCHGHAGREGRHGRSGDAIAGDGHLDGGGACHLRHARGHALGDPIGVFTRPPEHGRAELPRDVHQHRVPSSGGPVQHRVHDRVRHRYEIADIRDGDGNL